MLRSPNGSATPIREPMVRIHLPPGRSLVRTRFCPAQGACLRANARTKTAAQPHVLTGMAGFSSGGWLMPRLIRAAVGGAPPAATLRGHQWVEPDSEAVTEEQTAEEPALPSANVIRQVGVFCQYDPAIRLTTTEPPGSTHCRPSFRSTATTAPAHSCWCDRSRLAPLIEP